MKTLFLAIIYVITALCSLNSSPELKAEFKTRVTFRATLKPLLTAKSCPIYTLTKTATLQCFSFQIRILQRVFL